MANLSAIKLPNGTTYSLKDSGALQLTGGQVTGPVSFGDSVTMDEVTTGDLVVNGNASFTNNIQVNTINGVEVGSSPQFTDTKAWASITGKPTVTGSKVTGITASTTATKTTLGTAFTIPNVTSAGSASTWAFEDIACDDITGWSAGSGSASISGAVDSNDSSQLNITISHTHTAPTLNYTARTVSSKKSGANGSAPTLGTAFTVPNVTGNTSATVSITDPGHTHSI